MIKSIIGIVMPIAIAVVAVAAATNIASADDPPIDPPPPFKLVVKVEKVSDELCVISHNYHDDWLYPNFTPDAHPYGTGLAVGEVVWTGMEINTNSGSTRFSFSELLDYSDSPALREKYDYYDKSSRIRVKYGGLRDTILLLQDANEYTHLIRFSGVKKRTGDRIERFHATVPYNWTTDKTLFDIEQELDICIERLNLAYDNNKHKRETYERLVVKQNELTLVKEQLEYVREQEVRETELTIQLIALNSEILETVITIEQTRLAGLERRSELILEAAQKDAARWDEWLLESGNRFDDLETRRAETARVLNETKAQQDAYLAEMQAVIDKERENRELYEQNLSEVITESAEIGRQIAEIGAEAGVTE